MNNDTTEMVRCAICGEWHSPDECEQLYNGQYVCNGCALEHCERCVDCGKLYRLKDLEETEDENWVCDDCIDENDWHKCYNCGAWIKFGDEHIVDYEYLCTRCYEDEEVCMQCEDCGDVYLRDNLYDVGNEQFYYVCEHCRERNYTFCDRCERWVDANDYDSDHEMCDACWEMDGGGDDDDVHDYHWGHHGWIRAPYYLPNEPKKDTLTYGVEIEMADGDFDYDRMGDGDVMYHFEHDGSLSSGGVELITQPCSLLYHRKKFGWDKILQAAIDCGFVSHKCTSCSCGLHVHIGRKALSDTDELKLDVFFNRYVDWWQHLARRNSSWGQMIGNKSMAYCINDSRYRHGDHGRAVNHSNSNTVEIRIAKGTLKWETVLGTIEAYDASVHYLRNVGCYELYNLRCKVWDGFVQYVSSHPKEYPEAIRMMARLGNYRLAKSAVDLLDRKLTKKNDWNKKKEGK